MEYCSFDIETAGSIKNREALSPLNGGRIFSYCIGYEDGTVNVYRLDGKEASKNWQVLCAFFKNTNIAKVCHNYHFEYKWLKWYEENMPDGLVIPENTAWHDTMLMSQVLRNLNPSHTLDYIYWELTGEKIKEDSEVALYGDYSKVPEKIMTAYQEADGFRTMVLFKTFHPSLLADLNRYNDYLNEIGLVKTTNEMENYGLMISRESCDELLNFLKNEMDILREDTYTLLGEYANLSSDQQVSKIIFQKFKLPPIHTTKKGKFSTDKDVLLELREKYSTDAKVKEMLEMIIKWRSYRSGITTVQKYLRLADNNDVIHPSINTNRAQTGRESCNDPNLQNVAKDENMKNIFPVPARSCFRARPKKILYFVDYAGIELRLIIDAAHDDSMLDILARNSDVHHEAMECFYMQKIDPKTFPDYKMKRNATKNGHFALAYGANPIKVAKTIGVPYDNKFKEGFALYKQRHPKIVNLLSEIAAIAKRQGYIETPFGRRLYIPKEETYIALNYLIQGTAAGLLKRAQIRVSQYLKKQWGDKAHLVLPIHDELVIEVERSMLPYESVYLKDISLLMTCFSGVKVKLDVEWKRSSLLWNKAKEVL